VNSPEIDKIFEKLRKAGHGSIIKFDASNTGQPVEGIIFDPGLGRPPGYESGVFVMVPSDSKHVYYLDPEASKKQGRLIIQMIDKKEEESAPESLVEDSLKEFEYIRKAPDIKRGGGATGETQSKYVGIVDVG
jgi:hypothetical protein